MPPYVKTYGDEVNDFMAQIGRPMDPWQAAINLDAFGVRTDGLWSAFELLIALARQNGKGGCTEAIELASLFLFREPLILHSAHQFKTSTAAFRRLQDIIDGSDWLTKRVKMVSRSKGDESIELTRAAGGGRLQFVARTLGSGRGLTGSKNVFDEAYALTVGQYAAQTPTLSTIPNPQIIYTSTPPDEDTGPMPEDAMLPSVRKRGMAGKGGRIAMYEWSPPPQHDPADIDLMYECNPALGIRISEWFLIQQLENFTAAGKPGKFSTEHLGLWPPDPDEQWQYVPEAAWIDAEDPESARQGQIALCLEMSLDRQWVTIGVAGRRADGLHHVEIAVSERGTGGIVRRLKGMVDRLEPCAVVVPSGSPAAALIPDLEAEGLEVHAMAAGEVAQACGGFLDAVAGPTPAPTPEQPDPRSPRTVRHRGQGVLTTAAAAARTKKTGNTVTWDPQAASVDITPVMNVAAALWAFKRYATGDYDPLANFW